MTPWLIIRNVETEGPGLLAEVLHEAGIPYRSTDAFAADPVQETPQQLGGLIILGGPMGVYEADRHPTLATQRRLARAAVDARLPVLGICLGAQLLASAFGASVYPGSQKEIGWAPIDLTPEGQADPVLAPLGAAEAVFHLHGDTFDQPVGSLHLARSHCYTMQAFRLGRRAYGMQFHLEFTAAIIDRVLADPACRAALQAQGRHPATVVAESSARLQALEPLAREVFRAFLRSA
jgi:GMP synthase-like glutamine amidotransferase